MNLPKTVAYNTLIQIAGKAGSVVFGMLVTLLLTNYLGPIGFGRYLFALSYAAIFYSLADWGTSLVGVKMASEKNDDLVGQAAVFGNLLLIRTILSLIAGFLGILIVFFFPILIKETFSLIVLSSFLIFLFSFKNSLAIVFQTKLKMERLVLIELVSSLGILIFSFLVIGFQKDVLWLMLVVILANIIGLIIGVILVVRLTSFQLKPDNKILKALFVQALPMGAVIIVFSIYNKLDILLLQSLKGSLEVGIYGLAYRIYEVLVLGAFYFINSLLPVLSKEKDRERFISLYKKTFLILLVAGIAGFLGTLIFADLAIRILAFQKVSDFNQSIPLLRILGLSLIFSYLNHLTGAAILVMEKQRKYLLITLVALLFNLTANFFFIPRYSFFASAWITVITEALVFCLTSVLVVKSLKS